MENTLNSVKYEQRVVGNKENEQRIIDKKAEVATRIVKYIEIKEPGLVNESSFNNILRRIIHYTNDIKQKKTPHMSEAIVALLIVKELLAEDDPREQQKKSNQNELELLRIVQEQEKQLFDYQDCSKMIRPTSNEYKGSNLIRSTRNAKNKNKFL